MRLVGTADLHGTLPDDLPEGDVLVIAGDVCPRWDHSVIYQRSWLDTNFRSWLEKQYNKFDCIIGIGGNHDYALERHPDSIARDLPWDYLLDSGITVQGVKFWGTPWVPNLSLWAFHQMDHVLDAKFALVPEGTDIVVAHGPPYGYCDRTVPKFGDCHAGFPGWNSVLKARKPKLFICGHIHEGYGMMDHPSGTVIANVSHMTEDYKPTNPARSFGIGDSVTVERDFSPPNTDP